MTLQELEQAGRAMQQQWHDLVMAEQRGEPIETLEQLYDHYILLAEEYNRCRDALEAQRQRQRQPRPRKAA
jgi:uncharacterized protein YqgQ